MKNSSTNPNNEEKKESQISARNSLQENQKLKKEKFDIYQMVTDRIIEQLEKGKVPWIRPWTKANVWPENFFSKKQYRGINVFLLASSGFKSPYWLTYKQVQEMGGNVIKGERSFPVLFWSFLDKKTDKENDSEENQKIGYIKFYNVFNAAQIEGIEFPEILEEEKNEFIQNEACENIVNGYKDCPEIINRRQVACYSAKHDFINMPDKESFISSEEYYSTLFHEMTHSTGHEKRLNREGVGEKFGTHKYSKEELVAEMGAAFLCGMAGIEAVTIDNSSAYINNWISVLKGNKKYVVQAAQQAQKASDHILGLKIKNETMVANA